MTCGNSSVLETSTCTELLPLIRNEGLSSEIFRKILNRVERICKKTGKQQSIKTDCSIEA
jgi:hypothetical protein